MTDGKEGIWETAALEWVDTRKDKEREVQMSMVRVRFADGKDEYIGVHTVRIQKPFTQTTLKDIEGNSVAMDPQVVAAIESKDAEKKVVFDEWEKAQKQDAKDLEMIEQVGQVIVAVERTQQKSLLLTELLVCFADASGFESLLEVIAKPETDLKAVRDLVKIVSESHKLFHKTFVDLFFQRLRETVEAKLKSANEEQLRAATFQMIEETVDMIWIKIMTRLVPNVERQIGKF